MIKQSSLLKWAQNGNKNINNGKISKNVWIHPPEALVRGHVAYLVKFLGNTDVDSPKGIEVVKEGIRKLKFNQHLKRAEGSKTPKVELTISIDGVAIQEPKTKRILHQFPLHRISYCADDKSEKKFFSFIAKEPDSEKHFCFVFVSDKLAEEITLTIGQAFDLAYRKFLESSGRDLEMKRQLMILQKRVRELELENSELKAKINESQQNSNNSKHKSSDHSDSYAIPEFTSIMNGNYEQNSTEKKVIQPLPALQPPPSALPRVLNRSFTGNQSVNLLDLDITQTKPTVGRKLENLNFDEMDDEFNPRATDLSTSNASEVKSKAKNGHSTNGSAKDMFGSEPFTSETGSKDPFGMGQFGAQELETAIGAIDKKLAEMRDGFSRGLSFGNDEFTVETMDPLN